MKKILLTYLLSLIALCGLGQEHLSFKGVPITGTMTSFCQKLKAKGLTSIGSKGNITLFTGDFTGRKATIGAIAADNGKDVYSVAVMFDSSDSWNTLVNTYDHYKDLYIEKYGQPSQCVEKNPSSSDSNFSLMYELGQGRVTYGCVFIVPGGSIEISIEDDTKYLEGFVLIKYRDEMNIKAKRQVDLEEI